VASVARDCPWPTARSRSCWQCADATNARDAGPVPKIEWKSHAPNIALLPFLHLFLDDRNVDRFTPTYARGKNNAKRRLLALTDAGLFAGKSLGITLFSYVAVKFGICQLPGDLNWKHVFRRLQP
jgi:hypothetical protein